ncbi:MAG TPA: TonB-dependent receptor [Steroidobacter sp.]|uniref:TonB-dependent receptor n=1 Tax=Steroidobacter sp. TaxID=1978227 RepID=UPI002ED91846
MKRKIMKTYAAIFPLPAVLATSTGILALTVSSAAAAQTAAPLQGAGEGLLEEVVVTAQKRTQTLLEVPQSISVVGSELLERQQATTFADYTGLAPGLTIQQPSPGKGRVILRGVNTGGASPTVGIYVDETPFGSSTGLTDGASLAADIDPFDLERIEVLRGPQGTLYGANSLGGVLRFITAAPVLGEYQVRGQTGIETVDGAADVGWSANGIVNVPIGDVIAIRASGFYREEPGYIEASGPHPGRDINDLRSSGGRISLLAKPTDALSIRLTALAQDIRSDVGPGFDADPVTLKPVRVDPITAEALGGFTRTQQTFADEQHAKYRLYSATIDWDLDFAQVTSVTSYGENIGLAYRDTSFNTTDLGINLGDLTTLLYGVFADVPGPLGTTNGIRMDQEKFTQELRLASPDSKKLEWMIGGYYTREPGKQRQQYLPFDIATRQFIDQTITVGPPLFDEPATFDRLIVARLDSTYEEYAGFGSATWYLTPRFEVTGGVRYSHNTVSTTQGLSGLLNFGESVLSARSSESIFTWSFSPRFEMTDHVSLYARVAKGYRPGGPNVVPPSAPADIPQHFDSDTLISYEAGIRGETPDRTISFDASLYYLDWRDIQVIVTYDDPNLGAIDLDSNGDKARSMGAELTFALRPTQGLDIVLNAAYNDAELKGDLPPIGGVVPGLDGERLPYAPEWSASASVDYQWPVGANTAFVGASISAISDQATDFDPGYLNAFGRRLVIEGYETVNLRAGINFEKFNLTIYAKNVNNSHGLVHAGDYLTRPGDLVTATAVRPRTIGATIDFSF